MASVEAGNFNCQYQWELVELLLGVLDHWAQVYIRERLGLEDDNLHLMTLPDYQESFSPVSLRANREDKTRSSLPLLPVKATNYIFQRTAGLITWVLFIFLAEADEQ